LPRELHRFSTPLLDGYSVTVGGGKTKGNKAVFFLWSCMKKILYRVTQASSQQYQMAHGIVPKNELVVAVPCIEVNGY